MKIRSLDKPHIRDGGFRYDFVVEIVKESLILFVRIGLYE